MSFGPPIGFGGANSVTSSCDAGLPYAGVPGHLQESVNKVLESEPDHPGSQVVFEYQIKVKGLSRLEAFSHPIGLNFLAPYS